MHVPSQPSDLDVAWSAATLADAAALSAVYNAIADADDTPERLSPETLEHELASAFAPLEERTVVARLGDEVIGYGTVHHRDADADEMRSYVGAHVVPQHRDCGVEDAMIDWAVAVAEDVLGGTAATHRYVCAWLYKKQTEQAERFAGRGFEPVRHWWEMERMLDTDLPVAALDGIEVVPWSGEHSGPVRLAHNSAFADHWGSNPMDEAAWQKRMLDSPGFRPDLSFVALADGEIVGYAYNEVYDEDWEAAGRSEGWIGGLGVQREWRKRGIATALLAVSMNAMREAALDAAMIGVDSSSPSGAQHLYTDMGFTTTTTGTTWQRPVD